MTNVTVHLDGQPFEAKADETILALARRVGLGDRVPTLCFDPRLPPNGSCFLCVVEVEGAPRLLPACATPVRDGLVVQLRSDKVVRARKTCLELLLSNHDADCEGPCRTGCPAGIDIQGYLRLVAERRYEEAWRLIRERNPLVAICGRVCVRKCEDVCRRVLLEGPVGINHLKRVASDYVREHPVDDPPGPENGHRVAIVGAGPAGLTCAYYLRKMGTAVTLFEALPDPGGMLRWGIPAYRLPRDVLDAEVKTITDMGAEIRYGVRIGTDVSLAALREQGYAAVFLATGAPVSRKMHVKGEDGPGVMHGIDVLRDLGLGKTPPWSGAKVAVVGGGNTAIDVARTAVRLGSDEVTIVYRRTRAEMPAHPEEIDAAVEEGVLVAYLEAPTACVHVDGRLVGLESVTMELGEPDASGRRKPVPVPGSEHVIECDYVVAAIGQDTELTGLVDGEGLPKASRWGTLAADPLTGATSVPGVFAAGDGVTGPQAVIDAIGAARKAALAIQRYLELGEVAAPPLAFASKRLGDVTKESLGEVRERRRAHPPALPVKERVGFVEVEGVLAPATATEEAARCLQCGCSAFEDCDLRRFSDEYGANQLAYKGDAPRRRVDTRHPWITIDPNKCILCGRCVRTCTDVLGVSALGLIKRGFETIVAPAMNHSLIEAGCVTCGSCVEACPTGALAFTGTDSGRWRPTAAVETTCGFCGVGCAVEARRQGDGVSARSVRRSDGTFSDLCVRGRFGHAVFSDPQRVVEPLVRRGGVLVPVSLEEAVEAAADGLRATLKRHGPQAMAVTASPRVPCEDALAAAHLGRAGLGTEAVASLELLAHRPDPDPLQRVFGGTRSTATLEDVATADVVLLLGADPTEGRPVAALAIRRALQRGAQLVALGSAQSPLVSAASVWLNARRGTATNVLVALAAAVGMRRGFPALEGAAAFAEAAALLTPEAVATIAGVDPSRVEAAAALLTTPGAKVVAVADLDEPLERSPDDLVALADLLLVLGGAPGLLLLSAHANAAGVRLVGLDGEAALDAALRDGRLRGLFAVGEDPGNTEALPDVFEGLKFLAVMTHTLTETARQADVVFPLATHLEAGGTFVSADGVARSLAVLATPPGGRTAADVLLAVAAALGAPLADTSRTGLTDLLEGRFGVVAGTRVPASGAPARLVVPSLAARPAPPAPPTLLAAERRAADRILLALGRSGPRA